MFRTLFLVFAGVFVLGINSAESQVDMGEIKTFELETIFDYSSTPPRSRYKEHSACIDLVRLEKRCGSENGITYGERSGVNWDIFHVVGSQTRMVRIGNYALDDTFPVPRIEPWRKLEPGERRNIFVDVSGADGEHGANADGTLGNGPPVREGHAEKPVSKQVRSTITRPDGTQVPDSYTPYVQIRKGSVYAVRVFDEKNDHYLLVRVNELKRGQKAIISVKRIDGPTMQ